MSNSDSSNVARLVPDMRHAVKTNLSRFNSVRKKYTSVFHFGLILKCVMQLAGLSDILFVLFFLQSPGLRLMTMFF